MILASPKFSEAAFQDQLRRALSRFQIQHNVEFVQYWNQLDEELDLWKLQPGDNLELNQDQDAEKVGLQLLLLTDIHKLVKERFPILPFILSDCEKIIKFLINFLQAELRIIFSVLKKNFI